MSMKKRGRLSRFAVVVLGVGLAAGLFHAWSLDGLDGLILSSIDRLPGKKGEETEYAPGYSDSAFRRVRIGMPEAEVVQLLGTPLDTGTYNDRTIWRYARSKAGGSYRERVLHLYDGRVVDKLHDYYPD